MAFVVIIAFFWLVGKLLSFGSAERKEQRRREEIARIKYEQARQREATKAYVAEQKRIASEQARQAKEQERLAKEQTKQAEMLAKHEKRIADLEFKAKKAESDMTFLLERLANLDAQRDYFLFQQEGTVPGGKEFTKYQSKIVALDNQIHTTETKIAKAQHTIDMAKREIEAA